MAQRPDSIWRRRRRWIVGALLGLILLLVFGALRPMAPRRVDLLAGPKGSAYHDYATRYAEQLEKNGVTASVIETDGALDNLRRLAKSDAPAVALAQSGVERELDDPTVVDELVSLGSVAFEPVWLFVREEFGVTVLKDLAGHKVAIGPRGSGSRAIATLLREANGILDQIDASPLKELGGERAAGTLMANEVDAAFIVSGVRSPVIAELLEAKNVKPLPIVRTRAYAARFPALARWEVPRGVVDLGADLPKRNIEILAAATNLVVTDDMHSALIELLIDTARDVRLDSSVESPPDVFPSMKYTSLPVSPRARRIYEDGPSLANRVLPYGLAAIVDQIVFVLLPTLAIIFGILKLLPMLLGLRFSMRSLGLCRKMVAIERGLIGGQDPASLVEALRDVERESATMHVPPTKASSYLELRQNIHDARERIEAHRGPGES